jgi:hypothetical protein
MLCSLLSLGSFPLRKNQTMALWRSLSRQDHPIPWHMILGWQQKWQGGGAGQGFLLEGGTAVQTALPFLHCDLGSV